MEEYEVIAEIEWTGESYTFDLTQVLYRERDNTVWMWHDAGCSCPVPFEGFDEGDLEPIRNVADWDRQAFGSGPGLVEQVVRVRRRISDILK